MTWLLIVLLVAGQDSRIQFADGRGEILVTGLASDAECKRIALQLTGQLERAGFSVSTECKAT